MTIGFWIIPVMLSLAVLAWPCDVGTDAFGIGEAVTGVVKLVFLLTIWVIYLGALALFT